MALATADTQLHSTFFPNGGQMSLRKEGLLPVRCGKSLEKNEGFIEVWSADRLLGWIYFVTERGIISLSGYQFVGNAFVPLAGRKATVNSMDTSVVETTWYDGKELKRDYWRKYR